MTWDRRRISDASKPSESPTHPRRGERRGLTPLAALGGGIAVGLCFLGWMVLQQDRPVPQHATALEPSALPLADGGDVLAVDGTLVAGRLEEPTSLALLASQPEEKRNQILLVDLYQQLFARYPDGREQAEWFSGRGADARTLQALRSKHASETEVANFIAGALLDSPGARSRVPTVVEEAKSSLDSAATVGLLVARTIHYRDEIPRERDAAFLSLLRRELDPLPAHANHAATMTALLKSVSGSSDVGEHFMEDTRDDAVEVEGMKTLLRSGRLLVLNGTEGAREARYVLVFGFDREGNFLVRDPALKVPEKVPAPFLVALLRRPGLTLDGSGAGFWLDVSAGRSLVRCVSHAVAPPPATEPPALLVLGGDEGRTGVVPGAQVNLTALRIPPGEHSLRGTLSVTAEQIDAILRRAHSPAAGNGPAFVRWGRHFNVDPIYALAFFRRESVFGAHPRWIGRKPGGDSTKNIGNIRYVGRPNPQRDPQYSDFNGFRDYVTWSDGIHDWFKLIAQDANYAGLHTVERILPRYAPTTENDTGNYIQDVVKWVKEWRSMNGTALRLASAQAAPELPTSVEAECKSL